MGKAKVFLDSSVIISALMSPRGGSFYIISHLHSKFLFQINNYVLDELLDVIPRRFIKRDEMIRNLFILIGLANIQIIENPPKKSFDKVKDIIELDDAPILISAINESDYLVILDNHFLDQKVVNYTISEGLIIIRPKELIEKFR